MKDGLYVYGIIKEAGPQEFGEIGIGNNAHARVFALGHQGLAAIVSHSPWRVYESLSREEVIKDLAIHQLVTEKVMQRFTIAPVKFGTLLESEDEVRAFLTNDANLLAGLLDEIAGKIELDLVAWWELAKIIATLPGRNVEVREQQRKLALKGENVSLEDKILLGQCIERALKEEKEKCLQVITQTLGKVVLDTSLHDLANDEMIINAGFLLEKSKEELFHATVEALDQTLEGNINFRIVGPLPLYSFSTIVFHKIDVAEVEDARKELGISGELTEQAVRNAYRQRACLLAIREFLASQEEDVEKLFVTREHFIAAMKE
ncbi:GvpL/GvpF family gas vesicle protein [Ktedonobacter racemifer]|uniref:Gas vesicle synthesis GvpLGvpF n=1 Tax=Ktedonobacter racemifer DSM 44963 TaxID=485913 RepID=D6U4J5_KTERA|nr:GvpL/GvpF family gas vesicle protein [Ktedonobacter racemifer]EFH81425.1 Gas vesicle synthesis GvpLGvpF [Ktedonobacter racemifer DSM 44963]